MFQLVYEYPNKTKIITSELDPMANMSKYETCVFYSDGSSNVIQNFDDQLEAENYHKSLIEFLGIDYSKKESK